jgi:hypothetical protein
MRTMRSSLGSILVVAVVLVASGQPACSKDPVASKPDATAADAAIERSASSSAAHADGADAALPEGGLALTPPLADDWLQVKVGSAKLAVRIPQGATVPSDRAGYDAKFAGSYFRVVLPSSYDVYFAERHSSAADDVETAKLAFRARTKGKGVVLYEAEDALVSQRDAGPPTGKHCETTACGKISGRPICAIAAGARVDGTLVKRLTETECLAVVTIARSIRDL